MWEDGLYRTCRVNAGHDVRRKVEHVCSFAGTASSPQRGYKRKLDIGCRNYLAYSTSAVIIYIHVCAKNLYVLIYCIPPNFSRLGRVDGLPAHEILAAELSQVPQYVESAPYYLGKAAHIEYHLQRLQDTRGKESHRTGIPGAPPRARVKIESGGMRAGSWGLRQRGRKKLFED